MLRCEARGEHHVTLVGSGSDGEPAIGTAVIGGLVVDDVMQELAGLPNERLLRFENEGLDARRFGFSGGQFKFHGGTIVGKAAPTSPAKPKAFSSASKKLSP